MLTHTILMFLVIGLLAFSYVNITGVTIQESDIDVYWYVVAKRLEPGFLEQAERYKPDVVLLTIYAEEDIQPFGGKDFNLSGLVDELHDLGIEVYYSFSLFSRSSLSREEYDRLRDEGIPYSEQNIHMSDYARYLRETNTTEYHRVYNYYLERGLDPEAIPHVLRKPVDGFYIPPGHYTSIDPLYKPYRDFMVRVINETINIKKPDGLAFDHVRFFTFDDGYNQDIRDYILENFNMDIYNYTPRPMFQLNSQGWTQEDRTYYDSRSRVIEFAVSDIVSKFPEFRKLGTTMGMTDPARSVGQYVEDQANVFGGLLLMAYDDDSQEVSRNVKETINKSKIDIILGITPSIPEESMIDNINAGLQSGVTGIYLLGHVFPERVHNYLLTVRGLG